MLAMILVMNVRIGIKLVDERVDGVGFKLQAER